MNKNLFSCVMITSSIFLFVLTVFNTMYWENIRRELIIEKHEYIIYQKGISYFDHVSGNKYVIDVPVTLIENPNVREINFEVINSVFLVIVSALSLAYSIFCSFYKESAIGESSV